MKKLQVLVEPELEVKRVNKLHMICFIYFC